MVFVATFIGMDVFRVECLSVTKAFFVFLNGLGSDFCGMGNATCILGLD